MASYNRVILMGNLCRDVELKVTPSGLAVSDVTIAVNDRRKNAQGEWIEEPTFVDCTMYGRTAEIASEYLSKGSPIFLEGRLKLDTWEKDGQKRSKMRVICDKLQLMGSRNDSGGATRARTATVAATSTATAGSSRYGDANDAMTSAAHEEHSSYEEDNMPF